MVDVFDNDLLRAGSPPKSADNRQRDGAALAVADVATHWTVVPNPTTPAISNKPTTALTYLNQA